jgi:hypothetical protein
MNCGLGLEVPSGLIVIVSNRSTKPHPSSELEFYGWVENLHPALAP